MTDTVANGLVVVARQAAAILPEPPMRGEERMRQWEDLVLGTSAALARYADHDVDALRAALWPPIDAGSEPAWRVLLTLALLVAQQRPAPMRPAVSTRATVLPTSRLSARSAPATALAALH